MEKQRRADDKKETKQNHWSKEDQGKDGNQTFGNNLIWATKGFIKIIFLQIQSTPTTTFANGSGCTEGFF